MDRYVSRDLQEMICRELSEVAKKKEIETPATLDVLKSLTSSLKNLMKIDKLEMEKDRSEMGGYSQRAMGRYYVDGTYGDNPWNTHSYSDGRMYDDGNSYGHPRMYPIYMNDGYSRHGDKSEMKHELRKLMDSTKDESIKKSISDILIKMD